MTIKKRLLHLKGKYLLRSIRRNELFITKCQDYIKRARKQIKQENKELTKTINEMYNYK